MKVIDLLTFISELTVEYTLEFDGTDFKLTVPYGDYQNLDMLEGSSFYITLTPAGAVKVYEFLVDPN